MGVDLVATVAITMVVPEDITKVTTKVEAEVGAMEEMVTTAMAMVSCSSSN